jgi:hypothetical protein
MKTRTFGPLTRKSLQARAARALDLTIESGAETYDRGRHLPRLIAITPEELEDSRPESQRSILAKLARALRAERNRGRAGHWTYDLNRHIGLRQAYLAEKRRRPPVGKTPASGKSPRAGEGRDQN